MSAKIFEKMGFVRIKRNAAQTGLQIVKEKRGILTKTARVKESGADKDFQKSRFSDVQKCGFYLIYAFDLH